MGDQSAGSEQPHTSPTHKPDRGLLQSLVFVILWAAIFTLAYAQSPLYTSNQNQYFLHGLAQAGYGNLRADWLANTLDPTPVFSKLIETSWQLLPWRPVFYLYFGILAGIYLFSVFGIIEQIWEQASQPRRWLFLSLLVVLHSAALRYLISRTLGVNWDYLLDGGVANQRLLGTVLQPSTFGVLLVLSIFLFLRRSYVWAVVFLLAATYFHPTYLLSAGVLTAIYMILFFVDSRDLRAALALGVGALMGVIPILWQVSATFGGTAPELSAAARKTLVNLRVPHHALIANWLDASVWVKLGFVTLALVILWRSQKQPAGTGGNLSVSAKLFHILFWPTLIVLILTAVQASTGNLELALIFPWRLSTWLVPLSMSLVAGWLMFSGLARVPLERYGRGAMVTSLLLGIIFAGAGAYKFGVSWQKEYNIDERTMLAYVQANQQPGEVYLTPIDMQDFRLETGAPAFVDFKSIPYKDVEVLEWKRRVQLARSFYASDKCAPLDQIAAEGVTHLVLPTGHHASECFGVEQVYLDLFWGVYRFSQAK
ncbi:MAG TPA: hypothetical protein DEH22_11815 [Chloroflexi bacterium]|nr:hypothetical protein [Chloroflexota bacterium]